MRARAVIGANFGDEGKGLVTDYLCSQGAGIVVRFNGGAQAGHTVVTPEGERHVFGHVGAGAFLGVPTFLSQFFVCNPILFFEEVAELNRKGVYPQVYAHPNCLVTTFADMAINQRLEDARGGGRHGSCGVGFGETIHRSELPGLSITMGDLWNGAALEPKLVELCSKYAEFRTGRPIEKADEMIAAFTKRCDAFAAYVEPLGISQCQEPVFEGAQGLLLDQDNKEFFPHVTRSNTGLKNVRALCAQAGITTIEANYISRTYITKHGAGPLPGENESLAYPDETNMPHAYQGSIRFAPLDPDALMARISSDAGDAQHRLILTHCDQEPAPPGLGDVRFSGPTRAHANEPIRV